MLAGVQTLTSGVVSETRSGALCRPDHCLGEEPGAWTTLRGQGVPGEDSPGWGSASEKGTHLAPGTTLDPSHPAPPEGVGRG